MDENLVIFNFQCAILSISREHSILAAQWLQQNDNALLLVVLLLLFWLWLLVQRRQEEERSFRKTPLSPDELGRAVFMYCLSNDIRGYRSLYLTAKEAHDKLGAVAEQYLEQRDVTVLEGAFNTLCNSIEVGCIYKGIESEDSGILTLLVQSKSGNQVSVCVGTMTMVENAYRLLNPN